MDELRTERVSGSRPLLRDADELYPICADERLSRWIWPDGVSLAAVRSLLVRDMDHWKRHRFGVWILRDAATRAVIGRAGIKHHEEEVELDWLLAVDRWGEGLVTEVARAAVDHAFSDLGLESLIALTLPDNVRSRAVMERLGMVFEADVEHAGQPHVRYRLTK